MAGFKRSGKKLNTFRASRRKLPEGVQRMQISALADDGRGIAREQGKTVFVEGALPGETVSAVYVAAHKQFDEARTETVLVASDARIDPPCAYFGDCGGCRLQHLDYDAQLHYKQDAIEARLGRLPVAVSIDGIETIHSRPFHYRHRARFSVFADREHCLFGFKRHNSNRVIDIDGCLLVAESINLLLPSLKRVVGQLQGRSALEEVSVVEDSDARMAVLVRCKRNLPEADLQSLHRFCEEHSLLLSVLVQQRDRTQVWCPDDEGEINLRYSVDGGDITLGYRAGDFTQVNPEVNEAMLQRALEWLQLSSEDCVLDLFCGIGNFSLPLAKRAGSVTGIELGEGMVERARQNARANGIDNAQFIAADLMQSPLASTACFSACNKVLLDPPRAGAEAVCRAIGGWGVQQLVYISCNPSTFFRDAGILQQQGYGLQRIAIADMFPQTAHCELISLFCKEQAGGKSATQ